MLSATSGKEVMFSLCLFVYLFVCLFAGLLLAELRKNCSTNYHKIRSTFSLFFNQSINQSTFVKRHKSQANRRRVILQFSYLP